jgi:predicted acetyltransferase
LIRRDMFFGRAVLPVTWVADVATRAEFRGQGLASTVLALAERHMRQEGSVLGLLRTACPEYYQRRGWVRFGRGCYSSGPATQILARLLESTVRPRLGLGPDPRPLYIRYWRHYEQAALEQIYAEHTERAFGLPVRGRDYWRWLIERHGYDHIYLAVEGTPQPEIEDTLSSAVGFAVAKDGRILELFTIGRRPDAARALLARICGDAIENDLRGVRLDAPPDHLLHRVVGESECPWRGGPRSDPVLMVRLLSPKRLVSLLSQELAARIQAIHRKFPAELGLTVDGEQFVLQVTPGRSWLRSRLNGRQRLLCSSAHFALLLLGQLDWNNPTEAACVMLPNRRSQELARDLLPLVPLWFPPWDDHPA